MSTDDILDLASETQIDVAREFINSFDPNSSDGVQQLVGAYKTFGMNSALQKYLQARLLKYMKDGKKYKLGGYKTFDDFCKSVGIPRRTAYRILEGVDRFGVEAYEGLVQIGMRSGDLKLLKASNAEVEEEDGVPMLKIAGESVPISPETKDEIAGLVERMVKDKERAEKKVEKSKQHEEKLQQDIDRLQLEKDRLSRPIPQDLDGYQKTIGGVQMDLMGKVEYLESLRRKIDADDPLAAKKEQLFLAAVAWLDRFIGDFRARMFNEGPPSDEVFFDSSFANPEPAPENIEE